MSTKWIRCLGLMALVSVIASVNAVADYQLSDFNKTSSLGVGYVSVDSRPFFKTAFYPEFGYGPLSMGLDVNLYVPLDGKPVPSTLSSFNFRQLAYTTSDWGVSWGRLSNYTLGNGLIMDAYDSGSGGSVEFQTDKAAVHYYTKMNALSAETVWTAKNVIGARVQYDLPGFSILGRPVRLGATGVSDGDGVKDNAGNIIRGKASVYSADFSVPIVDNLLTAYTEIAKQYFINIDAVGTEFTDQSNGGSVGVFGRPASWINYRLEYRDLGPRFVPGYFGPTYEGTPFSFATDSIPTRVSGIVGVLGTEIADGYIKGEVRYEAYSATTYDPVLSGSLGWKEISNTVGVFNFSQRFDRQSRPIAGADILYKTGGLFDYVLHIKRIYTDFSKGEFSQTVSFEAVMDLDVVGRGIPFLR